jgi:predicted RNA-binding protein (virulence factor B family)
MMMMMNKNKMYGLVYRLRRKGLHISTKERTIYVFSQQAEREIDENRQKSKEVKGSRRKSKEIEGSRAASAQKRMLERLQKEFYFVVQTTITN